MEWCPPGPRSWGGRLPARLGSTGGWWWWWCDDSSEIKKGIEHYMKLLANTPISLYDPDSDCRRQFGFGYALYDPDSDCQRRSGFGYDAASTGRCCRHWNCWPTLQYHDINILIIVYLVCCFVACSFVFIELEIGSFIELEIGSRNHWIRDRVLKSLN